MSLTDALAYLRELGDVELEAAPTRYQRSGFPHYYRATGQMLRDRDVIELADRERAFAAFMRKERRF